MAFNSAAGRAEYTATTGQTVFPFTFKIFLDGDIKVYLTPSGQTPDDTADLLTIATDYTVSIDGDNGGSITLVSGATTGDAITLVRELDINRLIEYQNNGDLLADTLNDDQDYQTYLIADRETDNTRFLRLPETEQTTSPILPATVANGYIKAKSDVSGFEYSLFTGSEFEDFVVVETVGDLSSIDVNLFTSALVKEADRGGTFIYDSTLVGSDNQGTNFTGWVRQYSGAVNVKWFGATGDGTTDDTTAIQSAVAITEALGGGTIYFPIGTYAIASSINIEDDFITLKGDGRRVPDKLGGATVIKWTGAINSVMFDLNADDVGNIDGIIFKSMTIDGDSISGVIGIQAQTSVSRCLIKEVSIEAVDIGVSTALSCWGWSFYDVSVYNFNRYGFDLKDDSNNFNFFSCKVRRPAIAGDVDAAGWRIGQDGYCSDVNFYGCDFEAQLVRYHVDIRRARNVSFFGGYAEAKDATLDALIRVGAGATTVEGLKVDGIYFNGLTNCDYVFELQNVVDGISITGSTFTGVNTHIIDNTAGCINAEYKGNQASTVPIFGGTKKAQGFDYNNYVQETIADDAFITLVPPSQYSAGVAVGALEVYARRQPLVGGKLGYDGQGAGAGTTLLYSTATKFDITTGALTGTTGTDGNMTVSAHTDGLIYIENRLGLVNDFIYKFCEPIGDVL